MHTAHLFTAFAICGMFALAADSTIAQDRDDETSVNSYRKICAKILKCDKSTAKSENSLSRKFSRARSFEPTKVYIGVFPIAGVWVSGKRFLRQ